MVVEEGKPNRPNRPPSDNTPWHVNYMVEGPAGLVGYQIGGPASFLIFGDEVDELMALLAGIKVDEAVQEAVPHTRIYPSEEQ